MASKPNVLIIDGLGDVGRGLLEYIIRNDLAEHVLVVCKRLPALAFLLKDQMELYNDKRVEYRQRNINDPTCVTQPDGTPYDYVFNLDSHETTAGFVDEKIIIGPSVALAKECARLGVKALLKLSTGDIYDTKNNVKCKEGSKIKPSTVYASICAKAEKELMSVNNLNLVILRAAMIYGPSSTGTLAKYLAIAYIHKCSNKEMKLLGSGDDKKNTVHSMDVARAAWAAIAVKDHKGSRGSPLKGKEIYNISDDFDTDQKKLCTFFDEIFGMSTGFQDSIVSKMANINLKTAADFINSEIKDTWAELCKKAKTHGTPLSPFIDKNFLCSGCNLDSSKVCWQCISGKG